MDESIHPPDNINNYPHGNCPRQNLHEVILEEGTQEELAAVTLLLRWLQRSEAPPREEGRKEGGGGGAAGGRRRKGAVAYFEEEESDGSDGDGDGSDGEEDTYGDDSSDFVVRVCVCARVCVCVCVGVKEGVWALEPRVVYNDYLSLTHNAHEPPAHHQSPRPQGPKKRKRATPSSGNKGGGGNFSRRVRPCLFVTRRSPLSWTIFTSSHAPLHLRSSPNTQHPPN